MIFYEADIRNLSDLEKIFQRHNPQIINHHAAQKSVPNSVGNPFYDVSININGLLNLITMTSKYDVETFVYVSSGGALSKLIEGNDKSSEDDMPQLMSPYAINKFAGEKYLKIYSELYNFKYTILRYANVYGPRQIADGECGVIPIYIDNILHRKESILMTYEDMPRGCTRDYVYISDIVEANLLAMTKPINDVVNIGSGKEEHILDIYNMIKKVFEADCGIRQAGPRQGDIRRSVLNVDKAKKLLGWEPKVDLVTGLTLIKDYVESR